MTVLWQEKEATNEKEKGVKKEKEKEKGVKKEKEKEKEKGWDSVRPLLFSRLRL